MRRAGELIFRANQELANLRLWALKPTTDVIATSPLRDLPDPAPPMEKLRGTAFCSDVECLAESILRHRFPIAGGILETGERINWRRDHKNGVHSDTRYFRLIPYLDFGSVGDHKSIWDLNRHQQLVLLAQAFLMTDRQEFLDEVEKEISSWLDDNPYMQGINWTSALEISIRALSWIWVYHLAGARLKEDVRKKLLLGLFRHGCYLEHNLSIYFSPNTHLLGEAVSLHALGKLFPGFLRADRWRTRGAEIVSEQMDIKKPGRQ